MGAFLLAWTTFTAPMTVASKKTKAVLFATLVAVTMTFVALTIGAFAVVTNATWKRVLPVWLSA